jgi:hypothetical protein
MINFMAKFLRLVLLFFLLTPSGMFAQEFLNENFNGVTSPNMPAGWVVENTSTGTNTQQMAFQTQIVPYSYGGSSFTMNGGGFVFSNGDIGGSGCFQNTSLTSPAFNAASAGLLYFEFYQFYRDYSATPTDSAVVEVFNGSNWVKIQSLDVTTGSGTAPVLTKINITAYKNTNMKLRFRSMGSWPWFWAFDNVRVFAPVPNDVGITGIESPFGDCGLSASSQVKVKLFNFGSAAQTSIPVKFKINSGTIVTETFSGNLAPGAEATYTFTASQDLSAPGEYFTTAWTALPGDNIPSNDSTKNVRAVKGSASFGTIDFSGFDGTNLETAHPGWKEQAGVPPSGNSSSWRAPAIVQEQYFGTRTAAINLYTTGRKDWIVSPSVVPGPSSGVVFRAAVSNWLNTDPDQMGSDDSLMVMVSTNCGQSWTPVRKFGRNSGLVNKLLTYAVPLSNYSGQEIKLAFYATDGSVDDPEDYDVHIDSIRIANLPPVELGVGGIYAPVSGCNVQNTDVKLDVTNFGTASQSNFQMCLSINGGAPICRTFSGTLAVQQTAPFVFTNITALNTPGNYQLRAWAKALGDGDNSNDTTFSYFFQNLPVVNSFPYFESFENGNGGWIAGGTFSSWELGTPAKSSIQGAADGSKAYVTGGLGSGTYNSGEKSFILSPCMDFTTLTNPVMEMKAWWVSEFSEDGAFLQASIDGGNTWKTVGLFGDVTNWYTDNTVAGIVGLLEAGVPSNKQSAWSGGFNDNFGSNGWVTVRNNLTNLGGQANVKLRIAFGAGSTNAGDGFAFDAIRISERKQKDLAFELLERPQTIGCGLSDTSRFRIKVKNVGLDTIKSVTFSYRITGRPVVNQTVAVSIPPFNSYSHRFSNPENMSEITTYVIQGWAKAPGDGFAGNDSMRIASVTKRGAFTDTIRFGDYLGNNLPILYPGWSASTGNPIPNTTTTQWKPSQENQTLFYGRKVARLNMFGNVRQDWILAPAYKIQQNAFLNFDVAVTESFDTINDPTGGFTGTDDKLRVMVSTDCGSSWTEVYAVKAGDQVDRNFKRFKASLAAYAGQEARFAFWGTTFPVANSNDYDVLLDNIFIETVAPKDAGVQAVTAPAVSCGLGNAVPVTVTLKNYGSTPVGNFPVTYKVNQNAEVTEIFSGSLPVQGSASFTFSQTADLSISQPYTIRAYTSVALDSVTTNDESSTKLAKLIAPVSPQPLLGYNGSNLADVWTGWTEARGSSLVLTNTSWSSSSLSGQTALVCNMAAANKLDWVISPGIRINSGNFLRFKAGQFAVGGTGSAQFDIDDSITVMVSNNCGQTWKKIFRIGKNMVPAITNNMQEYSISLAAYANQEIRIGFRARDGVRQDFKSDIHINNIEISSTLTQDGGPLEFTCNPPVSGNVFLQDSTYGVFVKVSNFGTQPISNIPVTVKFANGPQLEATFTNSIAPGQSFNGFVGNFTPTALTQNSGLKIYTGLSGDQALANDTLFRNYTVISNQTTDVAPFALTFSPAATAGNSLYINTAYQVFVKVNNFGNQPVISVPVSVRFADNTQLSVTPATTIAPGQSFTYSLGTYTPAELGNALVAKVKTSLSGDQTSDNDSISVNYKVIPALAVKDVESTGISIVPNPASSLVTVTSQTAGSMDMAWITDLSGRKISLSPLRQNDGSLRFDVSDLPRGMYQTVVQLSGGEIRIFRLMLD